MRTPCVDLIPSPPSPTEFPDRCVFYLNGERKTLLRGQKMWRADGCGAVDVACRTTIEGEHTLYSPREMYVRVPDQQASTFQHGMSYA